MLRTVVFYKGSEFLEHYTVSYNCWRNMLWPGDFLSVFLKDVSWMISYLSYSTSKSCLYHWRYRRLLTLVIDTCRYILSFRRNHSLNAVLHVSFHLRYQSKALQMERAEIITLLQFVLSKYICIYCLVHYTYGETIFQGVKNIHNLIVS